jgi:MraZ protein
LWPNLAKSLPKVGAELQLLTVEPPRGTYPGRLDDKGRVKLPATFQLFLNSLREKKLFVTSIDRRIARIYPIEVWRQNEEFFETYREDPALAQSVAFNASDLGAECEMDGSGRVLFSPELRRELGIENQPVHMFFYKKRIEVLSEAEYAERRSQASQITREGISKLEAAGLN